MFAFEVYINSCKVCTAGIGEPGVLSAQITSVDVSGGEKIPRETTASIGGLVSRTREHVDWFNRRLRKGDEITLRIIETGDVSPVKRRRGAMTPAEIQKHEKAHFRRKAKEFGWKITTAKKPRKKY